MIGYRAVMEFLENGGWHKAVEIWEACGVGPRDLRAMAEETGKFIGGPRGYKRADLATAEELIEAGTSLESRARKTGRRGRRYIKMGRAMRANIGPLFANVRG
jgi:hypothetical protein